jgi:hypothetical protein
MTKRNFITSVSLAGVLFLSACNAPVTPPPVTNPPTPVPTEPNNIVTDITSGCALYNTLAFLVPIAINLASQGKLSAQGQLYLTDAQNVLAAACNPANTSVLQIAAAAAEELVAEIWQTAMPAPLPPPVATSPSSSRTF